MRFQVVGPDGVNSSCDEDSGQDMDQLKPHLVMANEVPTLLVDTDKTSDVAIMEFAKGLKLALEEVPRMQADPCATLLSGDEFVATEIESFDPKGFQHKPQPLMIAIVDTGVGILDEERIVLRENVTPDGEKSDSVDDEHGHGTHIFGIVRALAPPNAKFQIYKNIDSTGTWMDYTLRAIERAIENKADLVCVASSPSRVMGRKLMEQMDHIIETASNTKIFLAAGNDKQICHWPRETHSHPFVLIGSKNLSQEWSDFCLCTDRPLHPSFGQAIISNRSASLKGSLTKLTLDKFNWHTPLPTHLTHKDYLIMQGTSQATAFYTGVHTFQTDNVEQLCWDIAKQLKAYNVVARKQWCV